MPQVWVPSDGTTRRAISAITAALLALALIVILPAATGRSTADAIGSGIDKDYIVIFAICDADGTGCINEPGPRVSGTGPNNGTMVTAYGVTMSIHTSCSEFFHLYTDEDDPSADRTDSNPNWGWAEKEGGPVSPQPRIWDFYFKNSDNRGGECGNADLDDPSIDIEKSTNGVDADTPTGPVVAIGSTVTWEYVVTNTGNTALSDVAVTDNIAGVTPVYQSGDTNTDNKLDTDETWTYQATGTATAGQYENTGSVTGKSPEGVSVSDDDPSHYLGVPAPAPSIDIEKATNGEDADTPTGPAITVGDAVTWTYTVTNTGNVTLYDIAATDDEEGAITCPSDTLAAGDSMDCTDKNGTATLGQYTNNASVSGDTVDGEGGDEVTDDDPSHYFGVQVLASGVIGDRVWYDTDGDRIQDAGEEGIPGSTVKITGVDGQDVDPVTPGIQTTLTMLTGVDGKYLFSGLPAGNYRVETQLSWIPDTAGNGLRFTTVSVFNVNLPDGGENLTNDFGVVTDELPHTGMNADTLLILAILLMVAGSVALLSARREDDEGESLAA